MLHSVYSVRSYKHSLFRRRNARSSGDEEANPKHQTKVRSRWCAVIVLHQSDKWHNEATSLNVRAVSVALPVGLCRRQKGETREEGGHALRGLRTCERISLCYTSKIDYFVAIF